MTTIKPTTLLILIPTLLIPLTALSMEQNYKQLQLQEPKKQKDLLHANCSIMIVSEMPQTTMYAMKTVHTTIFEHNNVQSTIKDPIMLFKVQKNSARNYFYLPLPAKLFVNCTEGSVLSIYETDASQLYKSHPIFKKKQLLITAVCTKNPKLAGNSLAEQFANAMNGFYANPGEPWINEEYQGELETAGIIIVKEIRTPTIMMCPFGPIMGIISTFKLEHGPNGCSTENALIQSIIDENISENKNLFKSLMRRQINGSFPKK
jgi:hypothetical protein